MEVCFSSIFLWCSLPPRLPEDYKLEKMAMTNFDASLISTTLQTELYVGQRTPGKTRCRGWRSHWHTRQIASCSLGALFQFASGIKWHEAAKLHSTQIAPALILVTLTVCSWSADKNIVQQMRRRKGVEGYHIQYCLCHCLFCWL
jgi:hypothetical protein